MEAPKPKGFRKFDNLMRKLVKLPPQAVHINRRGCKDPITPEAEEAINDAAQKLAAAYRRKRKKKG